MNKTKPMQIAEDRKGRISRLVKDWSWYWGKD